MRANYVLHVATIDSSGLTSEKTAHSHPAVDTADAFHIVHAADGVYGVYGVYAMNYTHT